MDKAVEEAQTKLMKSLAVLCLFGAVMAQENFEHENSLLVEETPTVRSWTEILADVQLKHEERLIATSSLDCDKELMRDVPVKNIDNADDLLALFKVQFGSEKDLQ